MTLRELRYLVAIADHRHFGRAAEACCVTQPTLSAQLRKLEAYLGMTLIDRSGKQPLPTPIGEQIAERARRLLEQADEILQLTRLRRGPLQGALNVGVIPTLAPYYLPWLLPHVASHYPRLHLVVVEETTRRLEEKLNDHLIDAAFLVLPAFSRPDMVGHPLFDEPFYVACPADRAANEDPAAPLAIEELTGLKLLLLTEGHCLRGQALAACGQSEAEYDSTSDCRATSLETLRHLVAAGLGYTMLPALAARSFCGGSLGIRPLASGESRRIGLVWRAGHPKSAELRRLAAGLEEALPSGVQPVGHPIAASTIDVVNGLARRSQLHAADRPT
ncbi:MAG TPA: LysR substrate-binding domain-containing protein [Chloroflexota bacterium]|jgi:LysR family hydrogen peroxide-inducible transcriptional activator|nr:LysR substrate-binding domain-containing protein [Chloroflexota bacterium]